MSDHVKQLAAVLGSPSRDYFTLLSRVLAGRVCVEELHATEDGRPDAAQELRQLRGRVVRETIWSCDGATLQAMLTDLLVLLARHAEAQVTTQRAGRTDRPAAVGQAFTVPTADWHTIEGLRVLAYPTPPKFVRVMAVFDGEVVTYTDQPVRAAASTAASFRRACREGEAEMIEHAIEVHRKMAAWGGV